MKRLEPYLHYLPPPPFDLEKAGHTTAFWGISVRDWCELGAASIFWGISDRDWCELGAASIFWGISDRDWCKHWRIGHESSEAGSSSRDEPDNSTSSGALVIETGASTGESGAWRWREVTRIGYLQTR